MKEPTKQSLAGLPREAQNEILRSWYAHLRAKEARKRFRDRLLGHAVWLGLLAVIFGGPPVLFAVFGLFAVFASLSED